MLYLVVIMVVRASSCSGGRLSPSPGSAYILYATLLTALARNWLPALSAMPTDLGAPLSLSYNLAVHLFGFYAVALLTSYLGESASRAEEELAEKSGSLANLEVFHRDVIQSISSGLISTDLEARVTTVNRAALEILGRLRARPGRQADRRERTLLGSRVGAPRPRRRAPTVAHAPSSSSSAGPRRLPIGFTVTRLTDAHDVPAGWIVVFQDLSQWRRLQEELRLKDRMAAVGELAAGLAHEVGNPLAAISGSVQLLSGSIAAGQQERRLLDIIVKESLRLDRTIKGFLRFARPRDRAAARFDIAALLAENTALLRNSEEATGGHEFTLELDPESAHLTGDPDQISQIFWNLARNALRAMPKGGQLFIRGWLRGESYSIEFRDTGHGMSEEQRAKLFHPFQSFFDSGTGIGMAIVYRIVQEHGGSIQVESRPSAGTRIVVELPVHSAAMVPVAAEA